MQATTAPIDWTAWREERLGGFTLDRLPPTLKLPALPHAVTRFLEEVNRPQVEIAKLAEVLETDAGLTAELLRYVNSSAIGLRSGANSVQHALSLLGLKRSKNFVLTTGMQAAVRSRKSKLINQQKFWVECLQKAIFAKCVARLLKCDEELAFAGAMLQDYLLPVLTNEFSEEYTQFLSTEGRTESLFAFERRVFGWTHVEAGAGLAIRWQFPDDLICAMIGHHDGIRPLADPALKRSPVAAVALSAMLPDSLCQDKRGLQVLFGLEAKWKAFDLTAIAAEVDRLHDEFGLGLRNDYPLTQRLGLNKND